jgi:threonine dehydratase
VASSESTARPPPDPDFRSVAAACRRIAPYVHRTPVFTSRSIAGRVGAPVYFKCENLQRTGSFKMRGATHALLARLEVARACGVVTHSSGNHGAALALAARTLGVAATVVVPGSAPAIKRDAVLRYGARVVECGPTLADREAALEAAQRVSGALFVPPYDDPDVIAGQGTAALELIHEVPSLDTVWVPVGGGGLASGTLLACAAHGVAVRGAEPELADDAYRSLASGVRQPAPEPQTVADGLRGALGEYTFRILRAHDLRIHRVSEAAIIEAQRLVWNVLKLVVEPSGAVALAALLEAGATAPAGVILSGGNAAFP